MLGTFALREDVAVFFARLRFAALLPLFSLACALAQVPEVPEAPQAPYKFGTTVVISAGLEGRIYYLRPNTQQLPNFRKLKPVGVIYTPSLNVPEQRFNLGFPGVTERFEWFAIDYTGRFWITHPGLYRFSLLSDDGSKLYIDDRLVIRNDGIHSALEERGETPLSPGIHRIRVSYFQGPAFFLSLVLKVAAPGEQFRIFSTDDFKPPADAQWTDEEPKRKRGK